MAKDLLVVEQGPQALAPHPKVLDPDRGVHQDHAGLPERRLRTGRSCFSVPPSAAKRRALSRDIKASGPRRTSEVFSLTPVSFAPCRKTESSILSVVLICINMHYSCVQVKLLLARITIP